MGTFVRNGISVVCFSPRSLAKVLSGKIWSSGNKKKTAAKHRLHFDRRMDVRRGLKGGKSERTKLGKDEAFFSADYHFDRLVCTDYNFT